MSGFILNLTINLVALAFISTLWKALNTFEAALQKLPEYFAAIIPQLAIRNPDIFLASLNNRLVKLSKLISFNHVANPLIDDSLYQKLYPWKDTIKHYFMQLKCY